MSDNANAGTMNPNQKRIVVGMYKNTKSSTKVFKSPFQDIPQPTFDLFKDEIQDNLNKILVDGDLSLPGKSFIDISRQLAIPTETSPTEGHQLYDFTSQHVVDFANDVTTHISKFKNVDQIGSFWTDISSKINEISISFSPLSTKSNRLPLLRSKFEDVIKTNLESTLPEFDRVCDIIIKEYNNNRTPENFGTEKLAFNFVKDSGLFDEVFLPKLIQSVVDRIRDQVDAAFEGPLHEYLSQAVSLVQSEINDAEPFISPSSLRKLQRELYNLIFTSKFQQIVKVGLPVIVKEKNADSIKICVNLAKETDKINEFVRRLSHVFEAEADCFNLENPIAHILDLHRTMIMFNEAAQFSPEHIKTIRSSFDKGFNNLPDVAARLLAIEVNREFITGQVSDETLEHLLDVFKILSYKDVFVSYHAYFLAKRILLMKKHTVDDDLKFMDNLRVLCGPEYTKPLRMMFEGLKQSLEVMDALRSEKSIPKWFSCVMFSQESWPGIEPCDAIIPSQVLPHLQAFENKAVAEKKKRIMHSLQLTRVKLEVKGVKGIKTIKCNGLYASYLLAFNDVPSMLVSQISKATKIDQKDVEEMTEILKRKRAGNLILLVHQMVRINPEASVESGALNIAFSFPPISQKDDEHTKNAIMQNRDNQIDAMVVRILKFEKSLDREDLKLRLKDALKFRMDDEMYEKRLNSLNKRQFIKLDASGCVNYI